jgi:hypothetical protein
MHNHTKRYMHNRTTRKENKKKKSKPKRYMHNRTSIGEEGKQVQKKHSRFHSHPNWGMETEVSAAERERHARESKEKAKHARERKMKELVQLRGRGMRGKVSYLLKE